MNNELIIKKAAEDNRELLANPQDILNRAMEIQQLLMLYESGIKQITTKFEILEDEFESRHMRNPIETITSRIKDPMSIAEKLQRKGLALTVDNMVNKLFDIAGIRVTCPFISDVYHVTQMLLQQDDIDLIEMKDYIKNPKPSGYRSYHMIVSLPVYLSDRIVNVKVEIQIRTVAMDFWASLEHKIQYKFEGNAPAHINTELTECAHMVSELDARMLSLNNEIQEIAALMEKERQEQSR